MGGVISSPRRGQVWEVDFDPVRRHEQGGRRPALIISMDILNLGLSALVYAIPIMTRDQGGLTNSSFVLCDQARSLAQERLLPHWGNVGEETLVEVAFRLRALLGL